MNFFKLKTRYDKEVKTNEILGIIEDMAENQLKGAKRLLELTMLVHSQSKVIVELSAQIKELRDEIQNKNSNQNRV